MEIENTKNSGRKLSRQAEQLVMNYPQMEMAVRGDLDRMINQCGDELVSDMLCKCVILAMLYDYRVEDLPDIRGITGTDSPFVIGGMAQTKDDPAEYTDPDRRAAWDAPNEWNDEYIAKYNETLNARIEEYKAKGEKFTCEDMVLSTLIDFAAENGLPVSIANGSGLYNSRDDKWKNIKTFKEAVLSTTGANNLLSATRAIDKSQISLGDIILMDDPMGYGNRDSVMGHAQIVVSKVGDFFGVRQGNTETGLGAGRYGSRLYGGQTIEGRTYNAKTDTFYDGSRNPHINATEAYGMNFRRWNFTGMR
jgi:hypothetical protein